MSAQDGSHRRVTPVEHDDGTAHILHVDMDAFFASVELLDHPELRGRPVIVAHDAPRSVVTTANYRARRFGVRSAMPVALAKRMCPGAVLLPPRHGLYRAASARVMHTLAEFSPLVEQVSVDEAWIDVSGAHGLFGSSGAIAERIRERLRAELGLIASVGVAPVKFAAKLASGMCKPDGLLIVNRSELQGFLDALPVGALSGVGERTRERLSRYGVSTVRQVRELRYPRLVRMVGEAMARMLSERARGRQTDGVTPVRAERSIGREVTLPEDLSDRREILATLSALVEGPSRTLRAQKLLARTVTLKLRDADFQTISRSHALSVPTDTTQVLVEAARDLFIGCGWDRPTRLVGVRFTGLVSAKDAPARDVLWGEEDRWRAADVASDEITQRFGTESMVRATALRASRRRSR